jgi:hypothetical protein
VKLPLLPCKVIIELLKQYGQGGNCAEHRSLTYHNSFLIANGKEGSTRTMRMSASHWGWLPFTGCACLSLSFKQTYRKALRIEG